MHFARHRVPAGHEIWLHAGFNLRRPYGLNLGCGEATETGVDFVPRRTAQGPAIATFEVAGQQFDRPRAIADGHSRPNTLHLKLRELMPAVGAPTIVARWLSWSAAASHSAVSDVLKLTRTAIGQPRNRASGSA